MARRGLRGLPGPAAARWRSPDQRSSLTGHSHRREVNRHLREALDGLAEKPRLAVTLKYFGGATYEEIAGILQLTPKTVESLLSRTRRELAQRLRRVVEA